MRTIALVISVYLCLMISYYIIVSNYVREKESNFKLEYAKSAESIEHSLYSTIEYAYFEGQKDALNGDWRIEKIDTCYFWTKSCWDNNKPVTYNPPSCK